MYMSFKIHILFLHLTTDMYNSLECSSNKMKCHYENLTKVKHGISFPTLPLFINLNFFLQLISWSNKKELFLCLWFQRALPLCCSLCSHLSAIILITVPKKNGLFHTYSSSTPKMPLSTLFPIPALGYGKLFYHLGFSSTVTTFSKILLDRNNHSFPWVPTAYCSNLYWAYHSAFHYN